MIRAQQLKAEDEAAEVLAGWKAAHEQAFPGEPFMADKKELSLAIYLRHQIRDAVHGRSPSMLRARMTTQDLDHISKHNPLDQE